MTFNESTTEKVALAWHSHPTGILATRCRERPAPFPAVYPATMAGSPAPGPARNRAIYRAILPDSVKRESMTCNEATVEEAALAWFGELGYAVAHGPDLAPGEPAAERQSFGDVLLVGRLREAIARLNPQVPEEAREDALRRVLRLATPSLVWGVGVRRAGVTSEMAPPSTQPAIPRRRGRASTRRSCHRRGRQRRRRGLRRNLPGPTGTRPTPTWARRR